MSSESQTHSSPVDKRRILLFGSMSVFCLLCLGLQAFVMTRPALQVGEWTEYLNPNERAALDDARELEFLQDRMHPTLHVPGLKVMPDVLSTRHLGLGVVCRGFRDQPGRTPSVVDMTRSFWTEQGIATRMDGDTLRGTDESGNLYYAQATPDEIRLGEIWLWRVEASQVASAEGPSFEIAGYEGLLPPLDQIPGAKITGRPGRPGYTVMAPTDTDTRQTFEIVQAQLMERGWYPTAEANLLEEHEWGTAVGQMFRSEEFPLGCQLIVEPRHDSRSGAMAFISIF